MLTRGRDGCSSGAFTGAGGLGARTLGPLTAAACWQAVLGNPRFSANPAPQEA